MSVSLENRVAIVTGASRGIGRGIALRLAQEGINIVIAAKTKEPDPRLPGTIYEVAEEVKKIGVKALPLSVDVRDADALKAMFEKTKEFFGRVDILVNNAGAIWIADVADTPPNKFDLLISVNVRAAFVASHYAIPYMISQGWGHIINLAPPLDLSALPGRVAYLISKFGMSLLTVGLAEEVRGYNIAVNALWPKTLIESQATIAFGIGSPKQWRKADIVADALVELLRREPRTHTGKIWIDEELLYEAGVRDFSKYNCTPDGQPTELDLKRINLDLTRVQGQKESKKKSDEA